MSNVMNDRVSYTFYDPETAITAYLCMQGLNDQIVFGGTRVDPTVSISLLEQLQDNMYLKLGLHGSPVGAAKCGIRCEPDSPDLPQFLKNFSNYFEKYLVNGLVLGKDMGAKQWMMDEIYAHLDIAQIDMPSSTGRATRLCELNGYIPNMTGKGVFWAARELHKAQLKGKRFSVQGVGAVGAGFIRHVHQQGAEIVAVCDVENSVFNEAGLDVVALLDSISDNGMMDVDAINRLGLVAKRDALSTYSVDTAVLAGGSLTVGESVANSIKAGSIIEAANLAITEPARQVLADRGILVIPDICANSASATLVGKQLRSSNAADIDEVWADIESVIVETVQYLMKRSCEGQGMSQTKSLVRSHIAAKQSAFRESV